MNPDLAIRVNQEICIWHQQEQRKGFSSNGISKNILSIFQDFKSAYDSKNALELSRIFSESYLGTFGSLKSKDAITYFFKEVFESLPIGLGLDLSINVNQILEDSTEAFRAIIDVSSKLKILLMPLQLFDSGQFYIEVHSELPDGIWRITKIDTIKG